MKRLFLITLLTLPLLGGCISSSLRYHQYHEVSLCGHRYCSQHSCAYHAHHGHHYRQYQQYQQGWYRPTQVVRQPVVVHQEENHYYAPQYAPQREVRYHKPPRRAPQRSVRQQERAGQSRYNYSTAKTNRPRVVRRTPPHGKRSIEKKRVKRTRQRRY